MQDHIGSKQVSRGIAEDPTDHIGSNLVLRGSSGDPTGHIGPTSQRYSSLQQENEAGFA